MITALLIGAGALWLLGHKRNGVSGIGATKRKRRIWSEVEAAQRAGIDLNDPNGWEQHASQLRKMANGKIPASRSDKPDEQRYFNQLRRAYKSVAGTNLPYTENIVRNENDDVILIYRDYHMDELPQISAEYVYNEAMNRMNSDPEEAACMATIAMIATGNLKLVWKSDKIHRGIDQEAFGGNSHPQERKARISYLASPAKGGKYIDQVVHGLWESTNMQYDDHFIRNGVIDAVLRCTSVGQAQQMCIDEYLKAHQVEEPLLYQDVPF